MHSIATGFFTISSHWIPLFFHLFLSTLLHFYMYSVKKISIGLYCVAAVCLQCVKADAKVDESEFRANMIKSAFQHAWKGYSSFAYGHDELQPMTNGTTDSRYSKNTL